MKMAKMSIKGDDTGLNMGDGTQNLNLTTEAQMKRINVDKLPKLIDD